MDLRVIVHEEDAGAFHTAAGAQGQMAKAPSRRTLRNSARAAHSRTHSSANTQGRAESARQTNRKTPRGAYDRSSAAPRSGVVPAPSGGRHRRHDAPHGLAAESTSGSRHTLELDAVSAPIARLSPAQELIRQAQHAAEGETCLLGRRRLVMDVILDGRLPAPDNGVYGLKWTSWHDAEETHSSEHRAYPLRDWNGFGDDWDRSIPLWRDIPVQDLNLAPGKRFQVSAERTTASWDSCVTHIVEGEDSQV